MTGVKLFQKVKYFTLRMYREKGLSEAAKVSLRQAQTDRKFTSKTETL